MKSIKFKLFISYLLIISFVLVFIVIFSKHFFEAKKDSSTIELFEETSIKINRYLKLYGKKDISSLDKYIDLKNQFLIIFEKDKIIFTNQSKFKTQKILNDIEYLPYKNHRENDLNNKYKEFYENGFIELNDYIFDVDIYKDYEVYLGADERLVEGAVSEIFDIFLELSFILFFILVALGYILINKTIKPLKQILKELKDLEKDNDLSKRLKSLDTQDEFEELVNSLNKMRQNIEQSVESIKQFSSDASHELRTPLTVIQGELDLVKEKQSKEELLLVFQKIDKEQKKLQGIIKSFLMLSKLEKEVLKREKISLDTLVFELIEESLDKIEDKNLELKLEIDQDIEVDFNKKYLTIVLNNLLSNAIKYTEKGFIKIKVFKEKNKKVFEVEDSGIGISSVDLENIFKRFYRADKVRTNSKNGIGLGLAIVKKICTKFETKIEVSSKEKKGTIFKVIFN